MNDKEDARDSVDLNALICAAEVLEERAAYECAEAVREAIAALESAGAGETSGYITEVPDKSDRIIWRGHYYQLPPAASPAHDAPEQGAVTDEMVERGARALFGNDPRWDALDPFVRNERMAAARTIITAALTRTPEAKHGK